MIRTGEQYRDSIRDGREVWINGERWLSSGRNSRTLVQPT